MTSLKDRTILITGASSGIGRELVHVLAEHLPNLVLIGRNEQALKALTSRYEKDIEIGYHLCDLGKEEEIVDLVRNLKDHTIKTEILIHCAGIFFHGSVQDTSGNDLEQSFQINFKAPYTLTRELLDDIIGKKGQVVFMNSTASNDPKESTSAYASSKAALKSFAEVLRKEVSQHGVRIISIFPGMVDTPMQELVCKLEGRKYQPEMYLHPRVVARLVCQLLTTDSNAEIREVTIKPTTR